MTLSVHQASSWRGVMWFTRVTRVTSGKRCDTQTTTVTQATMAGCWMSLWR
jgi:hypothetical protein